MTVPQSNHDHHGARTMVERREKDIYKAMPHGEEEIMELKNEIVNEANENVEKFKDPVVLAQLFYRTFKERERSNKILANILQRLDRLEERMGEKAVERREGMELLLPSVDGKIIAFIRRKGHACAEDVKRAFSYKGRNAACARLNRLYGMGLLIKEQVGKRVYFRIS